MSALSKKNVKVSVITPTYNRAEFIAQAVQSVLDQTMDDFELLIVDDGSTDNTREVLQAFLADPRVHYLYQDNQGQSVARNTALAQSSGEFVCFLDSDNYWPIEKLSLQLEEFTKDPSVDVVYGDIVTVDEQGTEITRKNMKRHSGRIAPRLLKDNFVSMNTAMARRRCFDNLGGMSAKRKVADDYDLWLRFSAQYSFRYIPVFLAYYRVMENQISSDKTRRFAANEAIIYGFRERFPKIMSEGEFNEGFAYFHTRKARYLASVGNKAKALSEIGKAMRFKPFGTVPWRGLASVLLKRP